MKIAIRCTKVSERPDISMFKEHNPKIEQCEECKENIWVTDQSRGVRKHLGINNSVTMCKECALNLTTDHLKKDTKSHNIIHVNSDATEITEIKIVE